MFYTDFMNLANPVFTEYEQAVIRQIAKHRVRPNLVQRVLATAGKPVVKLFQLGRESDLAAVRSVSDRVNAWVQEGLIKTIQVANHITGTQEITRRFRTRGIHATDIESLRYLPMSQLDAVANSFRFRSSMLLGAEGLLLGGATTIVEGIPGAQLIIPSLILADVTTSMTLLSRHTCRIASTYGFSSKNPENLPHILAAMAPQSETSDEGYLTIKTAVVTSIRESSQFMSRTAGMLIDRNLLEREAPQMVRLIAYVADRLGVVVTEKELGLLVPIAGALLNSSINLSFQQLGHQTAQDYFRRLLLEQRYGEELVAYAIAQEIEALHRKKPAKTTKRFSVFPDQSLIPESRTPSETSAASEEPDIQAPSA